ncbi:MAG: hypothetical protein JJU00_10470 [Opitutales bacterium]|nr:hypothetical protein [Opitutales bacterium]
MDLKDFFAHWHLSENPFLAEEARNDAVYARTLEATVTHPDFQKIEGNPQNPSTSIVFGEKGSGKTAMRLMIERRLRSYNKEQPNGRAWIVRYDDINPVLDRLSHNLSLKDPADCLDHITLSDHQDAILSLAVTELLDWILGEDTDAEDKRWRKADHKALRKMSREKRLDLALFALLYDQPAHGDDGSRWSRILRILRVRPLLDRTGLGIAALLFGLAGLAGAGVWHFTDPASLEWKITAVAGTLGFVLLGAAWVSGSFRRWLRAGRVRDAIRAVSHTRKALSRGFWNLPENAGTLALLPDKEDQDKRYEMTQRLLRVLGAVGYDSLVVLIDRVDEPVLINSDVERMRKLVWPLLNNKFLQQERVAVKMLLPIELGHQVEREDTAFQRQARLDKQNLINPLRWTGATLYDLCSRRFRHCQNADGADAPVEELKDIFADDVGHHELVEALDQMHQPRDAFKFLYAVIRRHCENTPGDAAEYKIPRLTLEQVRREQSDRVMNLYRGISAH